MISLALAKELKAKGLIWEARLNDFFVIPDRDLDDRVFVLTDMMASLNLIRGWPAVTFHGAVEWALDYILTTEVIWLPTEEQLRLALEFHLSDESESRYNVEVVNGQYSLTFHRQTKSVAMQSDNLSELYAEALLWFLQNGADQS